MSYPVNCDYTMLMASLPRHKNNLFDEEQVPVSRIQLNKRLSFLSQEDTADLLKIEELLHWSHMKKDIDPAFVTKTINSIASINNQFIKDIVIWRLELRIILAALRMRHQGLQKAPDNKILGFDYWQNAITHYWHHPDFGLSKRLPWLAEANALLTANKSLELQKLLFGVVWDHYHRQNFGHYFNFEAVIIYVLRWDIINQWSSCDQTAATQHFNSLVDAELQKLDLC